MLAKKKQVEWGFDLDPAFWKIQDEFIKQIRPMIGIYASHIETAISQLIRRRELDPRPGAGPRHP